MTGFTVVEYYGAQDNKRCGYCVSTNTSQTYGMWATYMTVGDYQDLIDRGWRRSGLYCYKPNNKTTCCPSYTIKCDAKSFQPTKSHKKIVKKMNTFLLNGERQTPSNEQRSLNDDGDANIAEPTMHSADGDTKCRLNKECQPRVPFNVNDIETSAIESTSRTEEAKTNVSTGSVEPPEKPKCDGADPTKPLRLKAKVLRAQRKLEKQQKQAETDDVVAVPSPAKKPCKTLEHTLQSLFDAAPTNGRHKLQVRLVQSVDAASDEALALYKRYQIAVHNDPPQKVSRKSFEHFLVRSPLQVTLVRVTSDTFNRTRHESFNLYQKYQTTIHHDPPDDIDEFVDFLCKSPLQHESPSDGPSCGYGSFHQQYWLDDRLIAVGVIDILPKCVSSVYFFYDPDLSFLTLGTYGSLKELQFVQELNASVDTLSAYYMGFYIHSCPKMRYKGKLQPSFLLCPETYTWHALNDEVRRKLDKSKYSRLHPDPNAQDAHKFDATVDLDGVYLLTNYRNAQTYGVYKSTKDGVSTKLRQSIIEYGQLIGNVLTNRLLFIV